MLVVNFGRKMKITMATLLNILMENYKKKLSKPVNFNCVIVFYVKIDFSL